MQLTINGKQYEVKDDDLVVIIGKTVHLGGEVVDQLTDQNANQEIHVANDGNNLWNVICNRSVRITGNVGKDVTASGSVKCGNVGGYVTANGSVSCDNIDGDVSANGSISCKDITGDVACGGSIKCNNMRM